MGSRAGWMMLNTLLITGVSAVAVCHVRETDSNTDHLAAIEARLTLAEAQLPKATVRHE